ncbi:MAG TPA: phospholipid carrier-dependent glycosyltransferase [Candidatus Limnocylindria bacterium]|nr:phospholipid carrier-dependent glycosyltransferase [Candidatus Limnocylindria bacterium]
MSRFDRLNVLAITAAAALLRLPGIDARGRFDADQGHDMLTLVAFTRDGVVPLLGPRTSVGDFHHGAFYYFLLAPAAALSNGDPVAVTVFLAILGIAAVALTWWLARAIAGPLAGALAGILLAVSPSAIEQSTFIWNPNPIGFFAVLALAAAWRARMASVATLAGGGSHDRGAARRIRGWWALAIGAAGAVTQLHVLGVVFLVAVLALCVLEARRDRRVIGGLVGGFAALVLLFAPLLAHELQTGFLETQRVLAYIGGDEGTGGGPISALAFTLLRVVGWPLIGLVTDVPALTAVMLAVTVGLAVIGLLRARGDEAAGLRWMLGILAWSTVALAFAAPSLQRVVAGLPNDHYHAFLDPVVVILVAVPAAGLFTTAVERWRMSRHPAVALAGVAVAAGMVLLVTVALARKPPHVDPDGGWPAMRDAGTRVVQHAGPALILLLGLPDFKSADAVAFPIERAGGTVVDEPTPIADIGAIVVACDRLFAAAIGAPCGGPAEDALVQSRFGASGAPQPGLVDRFDASPRTSISIYTPPSGP